MMERRNLVGGGLVAGLTALLAPEADAAAAQRAGDDGEQVSRALGELRATIENNYNRPWRPIALIREQQRMWMIANHKYPDFIEVGLELWEALHDWHIRFQQPINMVRTSDGRYAMSFMFTTLILRPEMQPNYVGTPYDSIDARRTVNP
jgi:hypothetical protein